MCRVIGQRFQLFDLFYQVSLLVVELFVLHPIGMEVGKKLNETFPIADENVEDGLWFVRICDEHLEDVESLELDVATPVPQHVHHELEVLRIGNVFRHDGEIMTVEQEFPQQLERLSLRDVIFRIQQGLVLSEKLVVMIIQKGGAKHFMSSQQILEGGKGVGGDVERGNFDVVEEFVKDRRFEDDPREGLVADALAQHHAAS